MNKKYRKITPYVSKITSLLLSIVRNRKYRIIIPSIIILSVVSIWIHSRIFAATTDVSPTGGSPTTSISSRIASISAYLTGMGQGSDAAVAPPGDMGAMWNRIYSTSVDYSKQRSQIRDDYDVTAGGTLSQGEESIWTNETNGTVGTTGLSSAEIKKDSRTGLIWSAASTSTTITNSFTNGATARPTNGNAVLFCNGLNTATYGGKTDWYLPTQKELMQAYIDGIYSQDTVFGTTRIFWSSTELSGDSASAWYVNWYSGYTDHYYDKSNGYSVRCVRRD